MFIIQGNSAQFSTYWRHQIMCPMRKAGLKEDAQAEMAFIRHQLEVSSILRGHWGVCDVYPLSSSLLQKMLHFYTESWAL